jgi:hypothetical protein
MQRKLLCVLFLASASACQGAWYTPTSTVLDADTGMNAWEGPNDSENLGTQTGTHMANSSFTYFSGWAMSNVTCAATSSASLSDAAIVLSASNSTGGYGFAYTQATGSAEVDFNLASSELLVLNDTSSYADADQVSCLLTGPGGWTWTATYGTSMLAPAGSYVFSVSADVERTVGIDSPSSESASLQVAPEPAAMGLICCLPLALNRKRRLQKA